MLKVDLLNDSLNYNVSEKKDKSAGSASVEDLSDLNFDESLDLDIDLGEETTEESDAFEEQVPSAPEPEPDSSGDSLLADLGLDDDEEKPFQPQAEDTVPEAAAETAADAFEEDVVETPVSEPEPRQEFQSQPETSPQFDFSSADDEYDSYEEDVSFDTGPNKMKILLIVLLVIIVLGAGSYFLFFSGDSGESEIAATEEQALSPEQETLEAERQRQISALGEFWNDIARKNMTITTPIPKLANVTTANTHISMVRYRDDQLVLTVVSGSRDDLVDVNINLKKSLNVKNLEYGSVSSMVVGNDVKLVSDVSIFLNPAGTAGVQVDPQKHLSQSSDQVKSYFTQKGIRNIRFDQNRSSKSGSNVQVQSCRMSGSGTYAQISAALDQLSAQFPQIQIHRLYFYSNNQASISRSALTFELAFDFYQSAL